MFRFRVLVFMFLAAGQSVLMAQSVSNKGKEFWLGYGYNYGFNNEIPVNQQSLVLYLCTEAAANVTVTVNGTGWSQTVAIPANAVNATITIPKTAPDDARIFTEGLSARAVHIQSDTPIVAYAHLYNTQVSGATMLMPVESYGYKYYSLNFSQFTSGSYLPASVATSTQNGPDWYSWFYIVASENNTRLQITPSDTTRNGWLPGQTYTVDLNRGEIYNVMGKMVPGRNELWAASKDMTGSKVVSVPGADGNCHPIAFFSGSSGIRLCRGDGGEYMQQQVFPTHAWGTRYLTYHSLNPLNPSTLGPLINYINEPFKNFYRIAVDDPTTVVKRNGTQVTGLINNFYYEWVDSTGGDLIESDKPVLVAQYTPGGNRCYRTSITTYGDPELFYLSALEQGKNDVLFYATRNAFIDYNYLNVIVPTSGLGSLRLDGTAFVPPNGNSIPHPNHPGYTVAVARMTGASAQHRLTCDSSFTAMTYGLGYFESYGYNVGTYINNLNNYGAIRNQQSVFQTDSFTCRGTDTRLFIKVGFPLTSITWKLSQVQGIFPATDSTIANPVPVNTETINGRTYYVYSLQQNFRFSSTGIFYLPVNYTALVIENCSRTETGTIRIEVKDPPVADFGISGNLCLSDSILLNADMVSGNFNLTGFNWDFDDNTSASGPSVTKSFTSAGNHDIILSVFADNGCRGDTTKPVSILQGPDARFGITGEICTGKNILFSDSSSFPQGSITNRHWDFGGGDTLNRNTAAAFFHSYPNPGPVTVKLVCAGSNGCISDTASLSLNIGESPDARFGISGPICAGDSILIRDSSSINSGSIMSWSWNFGDGTQSVSGSNAPFYHSYGSAGSPVISLQVFSAGGCSSDTFRLTASVNNRPGAGINYAGTPCSDSIILFTSTLPYNAANPAAYYWNFGDGNFTTITNSNQAQHSYPASPSGFQVMHTVSYGSGCTGDTATVTIPVIYPNPMAGFDLQPARICAGEAITFTSTLQDPSLTWSWNFNPGIGTQPPPFSRIFPAPGIFDIQLTVKSAQGCGSLPYGRQATVSPTPVLNAGGDKYIRAGSSVIMDASVASPGALTYVWSPASGLNDPTVLNPVASPQNTVTYTIEATDPVTGCKNQDSLTVYVVYDLYIPSAFTPNGDGLNDSWNIPGLALYPGSKVSIINRYGQVIYSATNYFNNPWNGTFRGQQQPIGSYIYIIQLAGDRTDLLKGTITLIR